MRKRKRNGKKIEYETIMMVSWFLSLSDNKVIKNKYSKGIVREKTKTVTCLKQKHLKRVILANTKKTFYVTLLSLTDIIRHEESYIKMECHFFFKLRLLYFRNIIFSIRCNEWIINLERVSVKKQIAKNSLQT